MSDRFVEGIWPGDPYKRIPISDAGYQCGCHWEVVPEYGQIFKECPIHKAATEASVKRFEREKRKGL